MPVGNVKTERLTDILKRSPVVQKLRNIYENIEGECKGCEFAFDCYGCRGNAYQTTGNYLASDPACWLNKRIKKGEKRAESKNTGAILEYGAVSCKEG